MHKFNLIENASDSLEHAIQHMGPVRSNQISGVRSQLILI